jgi:hypothetical protein
MLMVKLGDKHKVYNYSTLQLLLIIYVFGVLISYQIIMGDLFEEFCK